MGLFTPDKAFEVIVTKQIINLTEPSLKCVDMVVQELTSVIKQCSESMDRYPRLRDEVESLLMSFLREQEQKCKEHVQLMIEVELSYMNTNHPDFIGYHNAASGKQVKREKQSLGNQVIRKGWIDMPASFLGRSKEHWFVLSSDNLAWYKDEQEKDQKYLLRLDGLRVRDAETGFISKKHTVQLYNPDGKSVYKDKECLELSFNSDDDAESWKASFLRAGVFPKSEASTEDGSEKGEMTRALDPVLERQVETIRNMTSSYIEIVSKTTRDLVPKTIMYIVVNKLKEFIKSDLMGNVYAAGDQNLLMEESQASAARREETLRMYHTCKDALTIVSDVLSKTAHTPLPPPLSYDPPPSQAGTSSATPSRPRPAPPPAGTRPAPPPPSSRPAAPPRPTRERPKPPNPSNGAPVVPRRPPPANRT